MGPSQETKVGSMMSSILEQWNSERKGKKTDVWIEPRTECLGGRFVEWRGKKRG